MVQGMEAVQTQVELFSDHCHQGLALLKFQATGVMGMEDSIAVAPLCMGKMQKVGDESSHPVQCAVGGVDGVVVVSLKVAP